MRKLLAALILLVCFAGVPIGNTPVTVANTTALRALPTTAAYNGQVTRMTDGTAGSPPMQFSPGTSPCGTDDGATCVDSADGKSWVGIFPGNRADASQFGISTSVTDNSAVLQLWAAQACNHTLTIASGTYNFATGPITFPLCNGGVVIAQGMYGATLNYNGATATTDLVDIGDATYTTQIRGWYVRGLNVAATTVMSAGTGIHLTDLVASTFEQSNAGGQYAAAKDLYNGIWCDFCFDVWYDKFEATATNDVIRASGHGSTAQSGFTYSNCKINGGAIGVHLGGGTGADDPVACNIIANGVNVQIDEGIRSLGNIASIFDSATSLDSSTVGPNVLVNDTAFQGIQNLIFNGTWNCTAHTSGLYIEAINGKTVFANFATLCNNTTDGVRIDDGNAHVILGNGAGIYSNGGYGINATTANSTIYLNGTPTNNVSGPYTANAHLGTVGGCNENVTCYTKDFSGIITNYFQQSVTGAANTLLTGTATFALTFPTAVFSGSESCNVRGFPNGEMQMTAGAAIAATTSGAEIGLVASGAVTNAQPVWCVIKGY